MKMRHLLTFFLILFAGFTLYAQSEIIIGFEFSDTTNTSFKANQGLSGNQNYDIRAEDTLGSTRTIYYTPAGSDFAGAAAGWDEGADNKFWSIKFKADGYSNFKISCKMSSGSGNPGPKNWKVQAALGSGPRADIPGSNIEVADDWTTGILTDVPFPASYDNPGSASIHVRFVMTSNESVDGVDVLPDGVCLIDDIVITGETSTGIEEILYQNTGKIYPNPAVDYLTVECAFKVEQAMLVDITGAIVAVSVPDGNRARFDLAAVPAGLYLVVAKGASEAESMYRKVVVK